jgi:hypothetical protein
MVYWESVVSVVDFEKLILDWKKDKRRPPRRETFAGNSMGYRQFVAKVASGFIPRVREFIMGEHDLRKEVVRAWRQLVGELDDDLQMLDAFDPTGTRQFFAAIVVAKGILRNKESRKAFEQSKVEPVDSFGNPKFISSVAAVLDTVLDQTYHALRGMMVKDLSRSQFRNASQRLQTALTKGTVKDLSEAKSLLLPQLTIVEMELERFLIFKLNST